MEQSKRITFAEHISVDINLVFLTLLHFLSFDNFKCFLRDPVTLNRSRLMCYQITFRWCNHHVPLCFKCLTAKVMVVVVGLAAAAPIAWSH